MSYLLEIAKIWNFRFSRPSPAVPLSRGRLHVHQTESFCWGVSYLVLDVIFDIIRPRNTGWIPRAMYREREPSSTRMSATTYAPVEKERKPMLPVLVNCRAIPTKLEPHWAPA